MTDALLTEGLDPVDAMQLVMDLHIAGARGRENDRTRALHDALTLERAMLAMKCETMLHMRRNIERRDEIIRQLEQIIRMHGIELPGDPTLH